MIQKKRRIMLFFAALGLQMGLAGQVTAAPVALTQGLIPGYMPAGQGQRVATFQPNYRYRPVAQRPVYSGYGQPRSAPSSVPVRFNNYRHHYYGQPYLNQPRGAYPQYSYYRNGPAAIPVQALNWRPYPSANHIAQHVPMPHQWLPRPYPQTYGHYAQPRIAQGYAPRYQMPQQWRGWNMPRSAPNVRYNPYLRQYAGTFNPAGYRFRPVTNRVNDYQRRAWVPQSNRSVHQFYSSHIPARTMAPRQWRPAMAAAPYRFRPDPRFQPRQYNPALATYHTKPVQAQPWRAGAPSYRWRPLIDPASNPKAVHNNDERVTGILGSANSLY
jgi:hypothetical protein